MITVPSFDIKGETIDKVKLPEALFGIETNSSLLAQAVRVYRNNQREASAKTKTRGEVKKTTAKMFRQKGTGRARHGSYSAPIFVGGGISHGPDGRQNFKRRMPTTMRRLALFSALSLKSKSDMLILTGMDKVKKTAELKMVLPKIRDDKGKSLLIIAIPQKGLYRASKNVSKVITIFSNQVNPYLLLAHKKVALTAEALDEIKKTYAN
jgi:large subunit ribosomal protein L4